MASQDKLQHIGSWLDGIPEKSQRQQFISEEDHDGSERYISSSVAPVQAGSRAQRASRTGNNHAGTSIVSVLTMNLAKRKYTASRADTTSDTASSRTIVSHTRSSGIGENQSSTAPGVTSRPFFHPYSQRPPSTMPESHDTSLRGHHLPTSFDDRLLRPIWTTPDNFDPIREPLSGPTLPPVRNLIAEVDGVTDNKAENLEADCNHYLGVTPGASGSFEEMRQAPSTPCYPARITIASLLNNDDTAATHPDGYGQIHSSERAGMSLMYAPVSEEVANGRAQEKLEKEDQLREERRMRGCLQVKDLLN